MGQHAAGPQVVGTVCVCVCIYIHIYICVCMCVCVCVCVCSPMATYVDLHLGPKRRQQVGMAAPSPKRCSSEWAR